MAVNPAIYDFFRQIKLLDNQDTSKGSIVADSTTDTLHLKEGENITLSYDATTDTITITGNDTDFYIPVGSTSLRSQQNTTQFNDIDVQGGFGVTVERLNANTLRINQGDGDTNVIHVSKTQGNDANDGINAPVRTIEQAAKLASKIAYQPAITPPASSLGAEELLNQNLEFIKDEVIAYIASTYPLFSYNEIKCRRDTGYIVNGAVYDLLFLGNSKSRLNAELYYQNNAQEVINNQLSETINANIFLKSLVDQVLQQQDIVALQSASVQIKDNNITVNNTSRNRILDGIQIIIDVLQNGLSSLPSLVKPSYTVTPTTIHVSSGDYLENNPIIIPDNCSVVGDSLRTVIIRPNNASQNMLVLRNGSYLTQMTFRDHLDENGVPDFTWSFTHGFDDIYDTRQNRGEYTYLDPTKPVVTTSPYIFNCSLISFLGGNGVDVNGDLVDSPNVPSIPEEVELANNNIPGIPEQGKSMIGAAYTMLTFGGTGWLVRNQAYSQLVSCFQIFAKNGVYTQTGGYVSVTNSATNFGLYALRSIGQMPIAFEYDKGTIVENGIFEGKQSFKIIGTQRRAQEQFIIHVLNSLGTDLTNNYKQIGDEYNFTPQTDVLGNLITIPSHPFLGSEKVIYKANGNQSVSGLLDENEYIVDRANDNQIGLFEDDEFQYRALEDSPIDLSSGTHSIKIADEEFFVDEIIESHNVYQKLTLTPGSYSFTKGTLITGLDAGVPVRAYVLSYEDAENELMVGIENVTIGDTELRNQFSPAATIDADSGSATNIVINAVENLTSFFTTEFTIGSTYNSSEFQNISSVVGFNINLHRPSIVNSSAHTWEYSGSGIDYNALPQNGGQTIPRYQQVKNAEGRVYTSGTNELGDFLVGDFITAENKTGNILFKNKVTITELDSLSLTLSDITINEISDDTGLGDNDLNGPLHSRLVTQLAVRSFLDNRLGDFIDKSVSTNAVPSAIAQLNSAGQLNQELIPATRSFSSFVLEEYEGRLRVSLDIPAGDARSGDIAIENYLDTTLTLNSTTSVIKGETVTQLNSNAEGKVKNDSTTNQLVLVETQGTFTTNPADTLSGSVSGALSVYPTVVDADVERQDTYFLNRDLDSQFLILENGNYSFTVGNTIIGATSNASGEITDYKTGVAIAVDSLNLDSGSGYNTNGTYTNVNLTGGSGSGIVADIVVSNGSVSSVDLKRGGENYQVGDALSANDSDIGGRTGGSSFSVDINDTEQRLYIDLSGNFLKFNSSGVNPDFIADNNAPSETFDETFLKTSSFDASTDVNYTTHRITISNHGYVNGDFVKYSSGVNPAIGNLSNNSVFRVKVIDSSTIELYDDYNLSVQRIFSQSSTGTHTFITNGTEIVGSIFYLANHGLTTGQAIQYNSTNPPDGINDGSYYFIGSVTNNTFTLHETRENALLSVNGITFAKATITTAGSSSTASLEVLNVQVIDQVNTSSTNTDNWSVLSSGNIDASNIISGVIESSRLGIGGANSNTFLAGDSTYQRAVKTLSNTTQDDPITITGLNFDDNGTTRYYADLDIRVENAGADILISNDEDEPYYSKGVSKYIKERFVVTQDGEVTTKDSSQGGTIDALTLGGANRAHYENPENFSRAVPITLGGTNLTGYTRGDILFAGNGNTANGLLDDDLDTLSKLSIGSAGQFLVVDANGNEPVWSDNGAFSELTIGNIQIGITNDNTIDVVSGQGDLYLGKAESSQGAADNIDVYINGDLYVQGTTTYVNTEQLNVADNIVLLNSDHDTATAATESAGITVQRGTAFQPTPETNKSLIWDETVDKWTVGSDTFVAGTVEANITGNVTGNADTADKVNNTLTAGTYLSMNTGSTFDGSAAITINHNNTIRSDTTSTASPGHAGTFTAIDSLTTNSQGHITAANVKTVTMPKDFADNEELNFANDKSSKIYYDGTTLNINHGGSYTGSGSVQRSTKLYGYTIGLGGSPDYSDQHFVQSVPDNSGRFHLDLSTIIYGNRNLKIRLHATDDILVYDHIVPDATANNRNLGSNTAKWNTVYATTFEGTATKAQYADLAEKYLADANYPIGTVIAIGGSAEVTAASTENAHSVLGVVSARPAFMMNEGLEGGTYVALKGRVLVQVCGLVKKGDRLAAGTEAGIAIVNNSRDAWSFAIALEDSNNGVVEAVIL